MRKFYSLNQNGKAALLVFWQKWQFLSEKINSLCPSKRDGNAVSPL
jgi:DNA-binding PadR family transcriptional regulator